MDKIIEVTVEDDFLIYVIGIEDLIIDRIRAAVHWESQSDREWALFLMNAQWEEIDFEYLEQRAEKDRKEHKLFLELKQEVQTFHGE